MANLSMSTIVTAALAVIVLTIVAAFLMGAFGDWGEATACPVDDDDYTCSSSCGDQEKSIVSYTCDDDDDDDDDEGDQCCRQLGV